VTRAPDAVAANDKVNNGGSRQKAKSLRALVAEAVDPASPPARLAKLARHRNRSVRVAVASNPNADRGVLVSLALTSPEVVADNPVLEWWLLEDANWLAETDERARHRLLGASAIAPGTRWWAARFGNHDDYAALLLCAHTTREMLEYVRKEDESLGDLIDDHVSVSPKATLVTGHPVDDVVMEALYVDADDARDLIALANPASWALELLDLSSTDLRRAVAAHASTSPALLTRLMLDDDERTIRSAEQNPASENELPGIAISALDLVRRVRANDQSLTLEQLEIVRDSPEGLRCLVDHPSVPLELIASLVADGSWTIRQAVANSSRLSVEQLEALATDDDRDVRAAAAANPLLALPIVRALQTDRDELVRTEALEAMQRRHGEAADLLSIEELQNRRRAGRDVIVAAYPDLPLDMQRDLAASPDWRVRHGLVSNPACSPSVLDSMKSDDDVDVRRQLAKHPSVSRKTLHAMCTDVSADIRAIVTSRVSSSPMLTLLAADADSDVRRGVVNNPASSIAAIGILVADQAADVRTAVARRPLLPASMVLRLAADLADDVRAEVVRRSDVSVAALQLAFSRPVTHSAAESATNSQTDAEIETESATELLLSPVECAAVFLAIRSGVEVDSDAVAKLLASVPWAGLVVASLEHLTVPAQLALGASTEWKVRESLAKRIDANPEVLRVLSTDTDYDTRAAVASNLGTPDDCISVLAVDDHVVVRRNVAQRAMVAPAVLSILILDEDAEVRDTILQRKDFQPDAAPVVSALTDGSAVDPAALDPLLDFAFIRKLAAGHESTTAEQLVRLGVDQMWEIRELVAAHMNTPPEVLASLAQDGDRDVRRNVAGNPNTPLNVVSILSSDADRNVARAANANVARSEEDRSHHRLPSILRGLRSKAVPTRILALSCVEVPAVELRRRRHFQSVDWRERFAVATHPSTEPRIREVLAADGLHCVRNAAKLMIEEASK
jgi:hypothetical protein